MFSTESCCEYCIQKKAENSHCKLIAFCFCKSVKPSGQTLDFTEVLVYLKPELRVRWFNSCCANVTVCLSSADGTISTISGSAMSKDPSEPAKLLVSFFESKISSFKTQPSVTQDTVSVLTPAAVHLYKY